MSSSSDTSTYEFAGNYSDPNVEGAFTFLVTAHAGFGDAEAFVLAEALTAAFPPLMAASVAVLKARAVLTNYDTNADAVPPSFT